MILVGLPGLERRRAEKNKKTHARCQIRRPESGKRPWCSGSHALLRHHKPGVDLSNMSSILDIGLAVASVCISYVWTFGAANKAQGKTATARLEAGRVPPEGDRRGRKTEVCRTSKRKWRKTLERRLRVCFQ